MNPALGKISVIIPCYNSARFLPVALESVLWQTYGNWECILVDDGSTDRSEEIIRSFSDRDPRFRYIAQKNSGPSAARNRGINAATGDYIQFLDADDLLPKERFERCMAVFQTEQQCDVVYTEYCTYQYGQGFSRIVPAQFPDGDIFCSLVLEHNRSFVATIHEFLFTKEIIRSNTFDASLPPYCEDVECWIRIADAGARFVFINEVLAVYRFTGESLSTHEVDVNSAKLYLLERYKDHPKILSRQQEYRLAHAYFSERLVISHFMNKSFNVGLQVMIRQWKDSSANGRWKMIGWLVLMLVMSKQQFASIRAWIVMHTPLKWGGWRQFSTWNAPAEIVQLLESSYE
jgi:hypothetical protein